MLALALTMALIAPSDLGTRIDNPYFPLAPGDRRVYRITDPAGGRQRAVATVLDGTKLVATGVRARVVYTAVFEDGERVEDNRAWYAQDRRGNVWYLGELARELDRGRVTSTAGSWEAGVAGARPGVIMPGNPRVGMRYRQERAPGVAQDRAEVVSRVKRTVLIEETEPIERQLRDYKLYVSGVGLVLGVEVSGGNAREELVRFNRGSDSSQFSGIASQP
jgi:hypothetical protein